MSADVRAPAGAVGWTPRDGWAFDVVELPTHVEDGDYVLTVSTDGLVRGVTAVTGAPLLALLRVEADMVELVEALRDVAESFTERLSSATTEAAPDPGAGHVAGDS